MKYTGYTKAELIEWCQCLEHNYNIEKERFEGASGIAQKEAIEIVKLRGLLKECVPYVTFKVNIEKNIGCTPSGAYLLIRIKDALGESEE